MESSDITIIQLLSEYAKNDNEAFNILLQIEDARKWEDRDIAICKAEHYLKNLNDQT